MKGFTLIETSIYIALLGILFAGIVSSAYPLLRGAEHLTSKAVSDVETAFIIRKITTVLASANNIVKPAVGATDTTLTVTTYAGDTYTFTQNGTTISFKKNSDAPLSLIADRVTLADFSVTHRGSSGNLPRSIEYSFFSNGILIGPIRKYLIF